MEDKAKKWLVSQIRSSVIGCCCEISNLCGHKYPFDENLLKKDYSIRHAGIQKTYGQLIDENLSKISMLLNNFHEYVNKDTIIDDWVTDDTSKPRDRQSHWATEAHIRDFKLFIKESTYRNRDKKLEHIINI